MSAETKTGHPEPAEISPNQHRSLGGTLNTLRMVYGRPLEQTFRNGEVYASLEHARHQLEAEQAAGENTAAYDLALSALTVGASPSHGSRQIAQDRLAESPLINDEEKTVLTELAGHVSQLRGHGALEDQVSGVIKGMVNARLSPLDQAIAAGDTSLLPYQTALLGIAAGASISTLAGAHDFDHGTAFMQAVESQRTPEA